MAVKLKCTYECKRGKNQVKLTPADGLVDLGRDEEKRLIALGAADPEPVKKDTKEDDPGSE